jgi:hypothetical protein
VFTFADAARDAWDWAPRDVAEAERRESDCFRQLGERFAKVGSFYPQRENFRLTREVKETFTEKLRSGIT